MAHATLLPIGTGKVLYWNTNYDLGGIAHAYMYDFVSDQFFPVSDPPGRGSNDYPNPNNIFCTGHALLPSGKLFLAGGHLNWVNPDAVWFQRGADKGIRYTNIYDPFAPGTADGSWQAGPDMVQGRWYPTNTPMADGSIVVLSGRDENSNWVSAPEVWRPDIGWNRLTGVLLRDDQSVYYPWSYMDPRPGHEGDVFVAGPSNYADNLYTLGSGYWKYIGPARDGGSSLYPNVREYGSSVMYRPGKILVAGGKLPSQDNGTVPTPFVEVVDLYQRNADNTDYAPVWRATNGMFHGRKHMNATMLPDGKVLVTGGTDGGCDYETDEVNHGVLEGEIWDPATENWTSAGRMQEARLYHSVALLLPDGRVLVGGGGEGGSCSQNANYANFPSHYTAEIYYPPYFYHGDRPVITAIAAPRFSNDGDPELWYNNSLTFTVNGNASDIQQVSLIRLPSVTHSFNQNQWFYQPPITNQSGNQVTIQITPRYEELPPGHYMLFALNGAGVPSSSWIVRVNDPNNPNHQ